MQIHHPIRLFGLKSSRSINAMLLPFLVVLFGAASLAGQLTPASGEQVRPASASEPLLAKVMEDLPRYGAAPAAAADSKPLAEVTTETVHLAPFAVFAEKRMSLRRSDVITRKSFAAEIFKRYDHSAFSAFQHREDIRLEDMAALQNYADNLMLAGDLEESRAIKQEFSRLFLRPHDPESDYVVSVFNPRIR